MYRFAEIDIVAKKKNDIYFVEVKSGFKNDSFSPMDHFDHVKKRRLLKAAKLYLIQKRLRNMGVQFDLVVVSYDSNSNNIEHFENVIEDS